jgi:hypothetical protein
MAESAACNPWLQQQGYANQCSHQLQRCHLSPDTQGTFPEPRTSLQSHASQRFAHVLSDVHSASRTPRRHGAGLPPAPRGVPTPRECFEKVCPHLTKNDAEQKRSNCPSSQNLPARQSIHSHMCIQVALLAAELTKLAHHGDVAAVRDMLFNSAHELVRIL